MKLLTLTLTLILILNCSLTANGGPNGGGGTSPNAVTGTGTVEVTVIYEDMGVYFNGVDQPGIPGGATGGVSSGEIDLGTFFPPSLSDCYPLAGYTGLYKLYALNWNQAFIPFYVTGSPLIRFHYELSPPIRIAGEEGVVLGNGNLTGGRTGSPNDFPSIPPSGYGQQYYADLNEEGKFYMRVHFNNLYIMHGCPAGERTFQVTLTCSYQ